MGVKLPDDSNNSAYAKFGKGDNAYIKPLKINKGWNDHQNQPQLVFKFQAVSTEGGESGVIPGYISSKITVQEDENFSSHLAKLLNAVDKTEAVLRELGIEDELVERIMDPSDDTRYEAETEEENQELYEAVLKHLADYGEFVLKAGTKLAGKDNGYSKVNDIHDLVEKDPFDDPAEVVASESSEESSEEDAGAVLADGS